MASKQGNVVWSFPQRRHSQFNDVDPVEKVLPKNAFLNQIWKVLMGRAEYPDIHRNFLGIANRADSLFLNCPQEFYLHCQRQVSNFVQKQSATVGRSKQAVFVFNGPGKAALFVPKKFTLHEFRGDGSTVDSYKGTVAARTLQMNHSCDQFFTATRFPADENRCLAPGQFPSLASEFLNFC